MHNNRSLVEFQQGFLEGRYNSLPPRFNEHPLRYSTPRLLGYFAGTFNQFGRLGWLTGSAIVIRRLTELPREKQLVKAQMHVTKSKNVTVYNVGDGAVVLKVRRSTTRFPLGIWAISFGDFRTAKPRRQRNHAMAA